MRELAPRVLGAVIRRFHDFAGAGDAVQEALFAAATQWPLEGVPDNPMVMLHHAIAPAMVDGPSAGLRPLSALDADGRLTGHHRLDAVRAHLLEMAGDHKAAIAHYGIAAGRATSLPERNYLLTQAARLRESTTNPASEDSTC